MKVHKLMKVILSFLTILFMLGSGNNNLTLAQGNQQGGRDVTDGTKIKITNFKIFRTNETTEVEKLSLRTGYDLQFDWDATAYGTTLKEGDYFTVGVPKQMNIDLGQAGKTLSIKDGEGNLVATAVITRFEGGGGHIKFTFTSFVNTHGNIKGNFKMSFILNETHTKANEKNNLVMTIDKTTIPIKPGGIEVVPSGTQNPTEILGKWAVSQVLTTLYRGGEHLVIKDPEVLKEIGKGATRWLLRINVKKDNLSNVVISDQLHGEELGNITMIPGTFALFEGDVDENGSAINTKNYKNISNDVQLSLDKRSFSYNLGNVQGKTYFLVYYTTYEDGSKLRPENKARLAYNVDKLIEKSTYFKQAEAGGVGQGDNANKIQIRKFDQDNPSKPLANAIFELYEQDKVTPVKDSGGKPIVLKTNGEGKAQSPQLIAGTYYLKEIKAPDGYLLPKEAGNNTEGKGKDNFYKAVVGAEGINVYISNKFGGTSVSGEKTWDDNNDQDGKRPTKITVILKKTVDGQTSEVKRQDVTPNSEGKWKYEFTNLPLYEDGKPITYSVDEVDVPGYTKETTATRTTNGPDYNLKNTHKPEKRTIEGQKIWNDNNNQDGKRPTSIKVKLYKKVGNNNQEYVTEKVVTEGADKAWKWKFENLDKYENKQEIQYTVEEEAVGEGYVGIVTGSMAAGFKITNSRTPEKTFVEGEKTWDDANNQDGKRPTTITVKLYKKVGDKEKEEVTTQEVKADDQGKWKYKFDNLPKYEGGKLIEYSVEEKAVDGYTTTINGTNITNKYTPEKTFVEGEKTWDDANNQDGKRPEKITVELYKKVGDKQPEKVTTQEVKADKDGNWKYKFDNLPKYEGGKLIEYSVKEVAVEGYTTEIKDFNITNKHVPEKTSVEGEKTWDDANNQDGKRPEKITVELYKKVGDKQPEKVTTQEVKADKDGNWKYKFDNLPKYEGGKEITYSIDEEAVPGYEKSIDGYNLKNSYTPEVVNVQGTKTWNDANNQDGKRPDKIKVILNKTVDGKTSKVAEKEVTAKDNWNYEFTNLPKYENGKVIKYSIDEVDVPGYEKSIKGYNLENKYIPPKPKLPKTGSAPSEVGGLGVLGLLAGYMLIRRKNKAN